MYLEELFGLKGKVILVTGGNKGIGKVVAQGLAKAGADIAIFSRSSADDTVKLIQEIGRRVKAYTVDVTKEEQVEKGIKEIIDDFGALNGVFNNAGICISKTTIDMTVDEFREVINTNLTGEFIVAKTAGTYMIQNGIKGSIVNTASMSGHIVNNPFWQVGYNTSKAGVIHMTHCLAAEWATQGVRVNSISPGYIEPQFHEWRASWLEQNPVKRLGNPEELVGMIICLLADSSSYTTGSDILVDGAYCCL